MGDEADAPLAPLKLSTHHSSWLGFWAHEEFGPGIPIPASRPEESARLLGYGMAEQRSLGSETSDPISHPDSKGVVATSGRVPPLARSTMRPIPLQTRLLFATAIKRPAVTSGQVFPACPNSLSFVRQQFAMGIDDRNEDSQTQ